jgi:hypothetical protein
MQARVTMLEIDPTRMSVPAATGAFRERVLSELENQTGFQGVYVLTTPEGKALLISLWSDAESAEASVASGYYADQIQKFATIFRSPPGRENYQVAVASGPAIAPEVRV